MILVDTSVWVDHLHSSEATLAELLGNGEVLGHVDVIGELAMGSLRERASFLAALESLPQVRPAARAEARYLIEHAQLFSRGLGWIDAQLLACARIEQVPLWTREVRMRRAADDLGIAQPHP